MAYYIVKRSGQPVEIIKAVGRRSLLETLYVTEQSPVIEIELATASQVEAYKKPIREIKGRVIPWYMKKG